MLSVAQLLNSHDSLPTLDAPVLIYQSVDRGVSCEMSVAGKSVANDVDIL